MLASLATVRATQELGDSVGKVYQYLGDNIEPRVVTYGETPPAAEERGSAWLKTISGAYDGTFFFHDSNWFTRMPYRVGETELFVIAEGSALGWVDVSPNPTTLAVIGVYVWRKFTGSGCLLKNNIAYRRWDQPI